MTTLGRTWMSVLSILQDMRQTRKLYSCLVALKQIKVHRRVSRVSPQSVRNYFVSTPILYKMDVSQKLNLSVSVERNSNLKKKREKTYSQVAYAEEENEYFHNYLSSAVNYNSLFLPGCKDDVSLKSSTMFPDTVHQMLNFQSCQLNIGQRELLLIFDKLTGLPTEQHVNLFHDKNFNHLCKCLLNSLPDMTNEVYFKSMATLSKFIFRQCITSDLRAVRIMIAKSYDEENLKRMSQWDSRQLLLAADFYFCLRCSSLPWVKYPQKMFSKLFFTNMFSDLGKEELTTLLLHASLARHIEEKPLSDALFKICQQIDLYTIEELGIISLAYFKTNQPVKHPLFQVHLASKLSTCVDHIEPICLSAVLKCLQKSTNKVMIRNRPAMLKMMVDLQPRLSVRMSSLTPQTALHVVSVFHNLKNISEQLISSFSTKLVWDDLKKWRFKDLALAMRFLANLSEGFPSKTEIIDRLTNELMSAHRENEIESHMDFLSKFLLGMAMAGTYSIPLLEWLFRTDSLDYFADQKLDGYRDLYQLSESVRIECPDYAGPLLPDVLVRAHSKKSYISGQMPRFDGKRSKFSRRDEMMQQCFQILEWVLDGRHHLQVDFLLPHYQTADIELCTQSFNALKQNTGQLVSHPFDHEVCKSKQRIAVLLFAENAYYTLTGTDGCDRYVLLGNYVMKRRQLKQLGFTIIEIPFYEYNQLETRKKYEYVLNKVTLAGVLSKVHIQKLVLPIN